MQRPHVPSPPAPFVPFVPVLVALAFLLAGCGLFGLDEVLADPIEHDVSGRFAGHLVRDGAPVPHTLELQGVLLCRAGDHILGYDATLTNAATGAVTRLTCDNAVATGRFDCGDNGEYDATHATFRLAGRLGDGDGAYRGEWSSEALGFDRDAGAFEFTRTARSSWRCA